MQNLDKLKKQADELLSAAKDLKDLEKARVHMLGRRGELTALLKSLKDLPISERKKIGPKAQALKRALEQAVKSRGEELRNKERAQKTKKEKIDVTRPGARYPVGGIHPLTLIEDEVVGIFERMGFQTIEGPDIETEYYNFDALNMPANHPARDMWDTFWLKTPAGKEDLLLRTHTSPMQARYLEKISPPLRIVVPGSTFRYEAVDATHNIQFTQIEGLLVDKKVSVANFKAIIEDFFREFFSAKGGPASGRGGKKEAKIKIRLRPSYFPFVEPGFEVDVYHNKKWLEMFGAGMVHPNVYKLAGLNPGNWQGFAFGMGIDRLAMVKYGINDIRLFYQNDIRFLNQF